MAVEITSSLFSMLAETTAARRSASSLKYNKDMERPAFSASSLAPMFDKIVPTTKITKVIKPPTTPIITFFLLYFFCAINVPPYKSKLFYE